jgi:hypothetical protein
VLATRLSRHRRCWQRAFRGIRVLARGPEALKTGKFTLFSLVTRPDPGAVQA